MIDLVLTGGSSTQRHYSDNTLRSKSFIFKQGDKVNYTSQATLKLASGSKQLDIYARNMKNFSYPTFKLVLKEIKPTGISFMTVIYGTLAFLCFVTVCSASAVAIVRCCQSRDLEQRVQEQLDRRNQMNWDDDQSRMDRIRQLVRQLHEQR